MESKIHLRYWLCAPILFITVILSLNEAVDFMMHDTYLVIATMYIAITIFVTLFVAGLIYWIFQNFQLIGWMTTAHTVLTFLPLLALLTTVILDNNFLDEGQKPYTIVNEFHLITLMLFLMSQLILISNVIIGIMRGKKKT